MAYDEKMSQTRILSNGDFLNRVEAVKADIQTLTSNVGRTGILHQQVLGDPYNTRSSDLEALVSETQLLNTAIKEEIKILETDAARSKGNAVKETQVKQLKSSFQRQLQDYRQEEWTYNKQYRDQIKRQYAIVNPEASEAEKQEAADADWSDEGVFQAALRTNRSATANTVLGAVRARHNDIQKIERTIEELNKLMEDLATTVTIQDEQVQNIEQQTENVNADTEAGNTQLSKAIDSAKRARRMKWWLLWICVAIACILALILGLYFGLNNN